MLGLNRLSIRDAVSGGARRRLERFW